MTLEHLWRCAREVAPQYQSSVRGAFEEVGLVLVHGGEFQPYEATPTNSTTFAETCVDGVHWGLLDLPDSSADERPVVMTSPMDFSEPHAICGENLREFLELARMGGACFGPPYDLEPGDVITPPQAAVWRFLSTRLSLRDRAAVSERVAQLNRRYLRHILVR